MYNLNMKKKLKLGKYAFLAYFEGDEFIWIQSDDNFKSIAKDYPILEKLDEFRWARLVDNLKGQDLDLKKPETIIDGLYFGDKVKEIYTEKYSHLKAYDMDELITNPDGSFNYQAYLNVLPQETKRIMEEEDNWIMFEGLFQLPIKDGYSFAMKPDVLIKEDGVLYLLEAKAVTAPKREHGYDVTYQWNLMKELGYEIKRKNVKLITLNNKYHKPNELDSDNLSLEWDYHFGNSAPDKDRRDQAKRFYIKDTIKSVTREFTTIYDLSFKGILEYIVDVQLKDKIEVDHISYTEEPNNWRFFGRQDYEPLFLEMAGAGEYSPFAIAGLTPKFDIKAQYWNTGTRDYLDMNPRDLVPKTLQDAYDKEKHKSFTEQKFVFNSGSKPTAYIQYMARKNNITILDKHAINEKLKEYKAPVYMYDFETMKFAVPENLDEVWPYEQVPYQYSIHVITDVDDFDFKTQKNVKHIEFLVEDPSQLGNEFWNNFIRDMYSEGDGTWVSYNKSFENMVIKNNYMKDGVSQVNKDGMSKIFNETIDLMDFFKQKDYYHNDFKGSFSIKKVGPHFAGNGDLDYTKLNYIQKGDITSREAKRWMMNYNSNNEADRTLWRERYKSLRPDMLKYCEYDTLSMVAIFQGLKKYEN